MNDLIVVINAGSATVKFASYRIRSDGIIGKKFNRGIVEFSADGALFRVIDEHDVLIVNEVTAKNTQLLGVQLLLDHALKWLRTHLADSIIAFGHRVVHGGDVFSEPILMNDERLVRLEAYIPLAPLHQPFSLAGIRAAKRLWPEVPQVACFDTAFHQTQSRVARMFGLPAEYFDKGVKRYGFHGLSYEFIARALPDYLGDVADGRIIVAHLGSGASLCAMQQRKSVATTMGFTVLDGLVMGTRCGSIDPGAILYLMSKDEFDGEQMAGLLYRQSGLLGVSGLSADMRELLASESPGAIEAIELFVHVANQQIGGLVATLGGLDVLVFTGGIGAHSAAIRQRICEKSAWAGIKLDPNANTSRGPRISARDSRVSVWALPTDEERVIADHTASLVSR
jgi:acetate kinase